MSDLSAAKGKKLASSQFKTHNWIAGAVLDGGWGEQIPVSCVISTVLSGSDYKASYKCE